MLFPDSALGIRVRGLRRANGPGGEKSQRDRDCVEDDDRAPDRSGPFPLHDIATL